MADVTFKLCIFGDGGVGKTTLTKRYLTGLFDGGQKITIGVDFHIKVMNFDDMEVQLQIWDFAGEERFRFMFPSYVLGANGGIFMYDITRYSSLNHVEDWLQIFKDNGLGEIPIMMVGGKLDLEHKRSVSREDAINIAINTNMHTFVECSAKSGKNVNETFTSITMAMLSKAGLVDYAF